MRFGIRFERREDLVQIAGQGSEPLLRGFLDLRDFRVGFLADRERLPTLLADQGDEQGCLLQRLWDRELVTNPTNTRFRTILCHEYLPGKKNAIRFRDGDHSENAGFVNGQPVQRSQRVSFFAWQLPA